MREVPKVGSSLTEAAYGDEDQQQQPAQRVGKSTLTSKLYGAAHQPEPAPQQPEKEPEEEHEKADSNVEQAAQLAVVERDDATVGAAGSAAGAIAAAGADVAEEPAAETAPASPDGDAVGVGARDEDRAADGDGDGDGDDGDGDDDGDDAGAFAARSADGDLDGGDDDDDGLAEGFTGGPRATARAANDPAAASAPAPGATSASAAAPGTTAAPAPADPLAGTPAVPHQRVPAPRSVTRSRTRMQAGSVMLNGKRRRYERRAGKAEGVLRNADRRYNPHLADRQYTNPKFHIKRPGVRVGGKDIFTIRAGLTSVTRYTEQPDGKMAPADTIPAVNVASEIGAQTTTLGKGRLALNPSKPRERTDPDDATKKAWFVLSWFGTQGSAWIRVTDLAGNASAILTAVRRGASRVPRVEARVVTGARAPTQRFVFAPIAGRAEPDTNDYQRYILANQRGYGNKAQDYLGHKVDMAGPIASREYYNVCLNLPSASHPPLAADVVPPGTPFFIAKGEKFIRETTIFAPKFATATSPTPTNRLRTSKLRMTWVYGFVGKSATEPDPARGGWVPLRVLLKR